MTLSPVSAQFVSLWTEFAEAVIEEGIGGKETGKTERAKTLLFIHVSDMEAAYRSHATLLSALEELLGAQITTHRSGSVVWLECLCCAKFALQEAVTEFPLGLHDPSNPCGRAAAAIRAAKGESK